MKKYIQHIIKNYSFLHFYENYSFHNYTFHFLFKNDLPYKNYPNGLPSNFNVLVCSLSFLKSLGMYGGSIFSCNKSVQSIPEKYGLFFIFSKVAFIALTFEFFSSKSSNNYFASLLTAALSGKTIVSVLIFFITT